MKILLIHDYATPSFGAENQVLALRDGLRRRGHDARLFASSARPAVKREVLADYVCFGTASRLQTIFQAINPWAFFALHRVLREFRPDVVHVRMFLTQLSPLILPLLRKIPSIYHVVSYRPICPMSNKMSPDGRVCRHPAGTVCYHRCLPLRSFIFQIPELWLWKRWRKAFDLIVVNSHSLMHELQRQRIEPAQVIWNPVPMMDSPRRPLSPPPVVAFAGRMDSGKGADLLLKAFSRLLKKIPEARLILAGDGPDLRELKTLASELGLSKRAVFTGHLLRGDMERLFQAAWVQAVPTRCMEAFGNVAAEAMMRGTAVVASEIGGLSEIVQGGTTGLLVPPGDVDALTAAMAVFLQDLELAERMGRAGRAFALKHFDPEAYLDRIIGLYQTLIKSAAS
ncbi:MAG: glycosyltransferase family 4 protein [Pseudomonadota bacterium]